MTGRAFWKEAGYEQQYLDGYFRNTDYTEYPDGSGAQNAHAAGYEDWRNDVQAKCEVKPEDWK